MGKGEAVVWGEGDGWGLSSGFLESSTAGPPSLPEQGRGGVYLPSGPGYPFSFLVVQAD